MIDPTVTAIVERLLTPAQREVFDLHHGRGWSFDRISIHLLLHKSTIRSRYDGAWIKLQRAGVRFTPDGHPYLEKETTA